MKSHQTCAGLYRPPFLSCPKSHGINKDPILISIARHPMEPHIERHRVSSMLLVRKFAAFLSIAQEVTASQPRALVRVFF